MSLPARVGGEIPCDDERFKERERERRRLQLCWLACCHDDGFGVCNVDVPYSYINRLGIAGCDCTLVWVQDRQVRFSCRK